LLADFINFIYILGDMARWIHLITLWYRKKC